MKRSALLPVLTYPDASSTEAIANCLRMAVQLDCRVHALVINVDIPPISNAFSRVLADTPNMVRRAENASRERGAEVLAEIQARGAEYGVSITPDIVAAAPAFMADTAATHARYFDLALVGWRAKDETSRAAAEAVVFGSGRPTILVPDIAPNTSGDHVAIAWDGSRVAARAVADAAPMLQRAEKISVLTVFGEKRLLEENPGERLLASLVRAGLPAAALEIPAEECPISIRCNIEPLKPAQQCL